MKGHANGTIYHVGLKHSFYGTIEWQHFFSPEPACLSFSLSQRCYSALLWWEKMLDWVLIFHIDQITCIENISFCDEYFKQLSSIIESQESFSSFDVEIFSVRMNPREVKNWEDWNLNWLNCSLNPETKIASLENSNNLEKKINCNFIFLMWTDRTTLRIRRNHRYVIFKDSWSDQLCKWTLKKLQ